MRVKPFLTNFSCAPMPKEKLGKHNTGLAFEIFSIKFTHANSMDEQDEHVLDLL